MTALTWDQRNYESGVDKGVLYPQNSPGVAWSGLVQIAENPPASDGSCYFDGVKYYDDPGTDAPSFSLEAFTYPSKFVEGVPFGLCYRTSHISGYRLHLIYNAVAAPAKRSTATTSRVVDPENFQWDLSTTPIHIPGAAPSSHLVVDSALCSAVAFNLVQEQLYGTPNFAPYLPPADGVIAMMSSTNGFAVVDHGDGTWSAYGPDSMIQMLDTESFQITSPSLNMIDADSYSVSST